MGYNSQRGPLESWTLCIRCACHSSRVNDSFRILGVLLLSVVLIFSTFQLFNARFSIMRRCLASTGGPFCVRMVNMRPGRCLWECQVHGPGEIGAHHSAVITITLTIWCMHHHWLLFSGTQYAVMHLFNIFQWFRLYGVWCSSLRHCLTWANILPLQKIPKRDNDLVQNWGRKKKSSEPDWPPSELRHHITCASVKKGTVKLN